MDRIAEKIFTKYPITEVWVRRIYAKVRELKPIKQFAKRFVGNKIETDGKIDVTCTPEQLFCCVEKYGIQKGDILIVHSSMDTLCKANLSAKKTIDWLLALVGEEGTLVMPAFPHFTEKENIDGEDAEVYDVKRTLAWTGMLPNLFLRYPGVIRSEWPCNPLAAKGSHAAEMMCDNLNAPVSQGRGTSWNYCAEHHAKVLFLGVKPFHSLSESHIAEDYMYEEWPIDNWYIEQKYVIKKGKERFPLTLKKRDPRWATYLTEYRNAEQLRNSGMLQEDDFCDIPIGFIADLKDFVDKFIVNIQNGELGYRIPKRYWKKRVSGVKE